MKKKRWYLKAAIAGMLLAAAWGGYSYQKNRIIVLEFGMFAGSNWDVANANSYHIIDAAIEQFEKEHDNVKIHYYSGILKDDYSEWISRKVLEGSPPDIYMTLASDFNQFASIGIMKDLSELIEEDREFDQERYFSTALETGIYNNKQYALPYETVPTLMFVNKTLLQKEGILVPDNDWTWEDLYQICEKVTQDTNGDGYLDQFGTYNYSWTDAVYSNGGQLFNEDGSESYFNHKSVTEAIKQTKKIQELNQGQKVSQADFDAGRVAFMPLLFSDYRTYKTYPYKIKKYTNFQWDCITLPAGPKGGNISEVNTLLMGISKRTKHEELAWEFLKLLTYDETIQMKIFSHSQGASVLKAVTNSETAERLMRDTEENDFVIDRQLLSKVMEEGAVAPKFPKYEEALLLADNEITKIIEGDMNIDSSLKIFQRSINRYLKQ